MLYTLSHEIVHDIRATNPASFENLFEFVVNEYIRQGKSADDILSHYELKYKDKDLAREEFVPDSMESVLVRAFEGDTKPLSILKSKCHDVWLKIREMLTRIARTIVNEYKGLMPDSEAGRFVAQLSDDTFNVLKDMYFDAMSKAAESRQHFRGLDELVAFLDEHNISREGTDLEHNKTKNTANNDGVKHFSRENSSSLREQIIENIDLLNNMDIVAWVNSDFEFTTKQEARDWAVEQLEEYGDIINRSGFGNVILDSKRIKNGFRYLKNENEIIAFATVPQIIMKGIKIGEHSNHKNRLYNTVTFAGPVSINGTRGNVAVVVRMADNNYYKMHRLVLPDGTQFVFDIKKEDTTERAGGVNENSGLSPTDDVSTSIIPDSSEKSNTKIKKSDRDTAYLEAVESGDMENEDIRYSSRDTLDTIEQSFGINKVNDYVHVQKQVIQTLTNEGFFDKNIVKVIENNMVVEITKDGIKETLGPGKRYQSLPRLFKKLKLTTLRDLPIIIANSKILEDNVSDIHNENSNLKYTYLENKVLVDDVEYNVTIAIRKSPQKNKFWVHEIRINKKEQSLSPSSDNLKQESMEFSVHNDNVSQNSDDVKDNKLYQARPDFADILFDDFEGEVTDDDSRLITEYINGKTDVVNHLINNTRNIPLSEHKMRGLVSRLLKSYELSEDSKNDVYIALTSLLESNDKTNVKDNLGLLLGVGRLKKSSQTTALFMCSV